MTLAAIGRRVGVSPQAVAAWEYGKAEPSIDNLCIMARLLEIKLNELLGVYNSSGVLALADKLEEAITLMPTAEGVLTDGEARNSAPHSGLYLVELKEGDAAKIVGRVVWPQKK